METAIENPFRIVKAGDFTDQQINDYWVDLPQGNGFSDIVDPLSTMPMILLGGKGSGKTHLMRYYSYSLQKIRHKNSIINGIQTDKFIGIYLRCGALNSERFSEKSFANENWLKIFPYYFEICLAQLVLEIVSDLLQESAITNFDEVSLCKAIINCFDKSPKDGVVSLEELLECLATLQKNIDYKVNNCIFSGNLDVEILATPGKLFFGIPQCLTKFIPELKNILFVYLIDELENLLEGQQRYIQSLIRDRSFPSSIKIGVRTYGIKTYATFADGEQNREGSEFELVRLDSRMRENDQQYKTFAIDLCIKRLKEAGLLSLTTNISAEDFYAFFESEMPFDELSDIEGITSGSGGKTITKLRKQLLRSKRRIVERGLAKDSDFEEIIKYLSLEGMPLLERAAVFSFYKAWANSKNLLSAAKEINSECNNYIEDRTSEPKFAELISKFKLDLLAQLRRDNSKKQVYAGVDTLINISKGFPRNLLTIFKHIYNYSIFNGEKPFKSGRISLSSQVEGVNQSSMWYFEDARIAGKDGAQLKAAIERVAELFRINRYSDKPTECSLSAFYTNLAEASDETQRLVDLASKWSLLLLDSKGRPEKNSSRVSEKFAINPMLSPHWGLPIAIRGVISFNSETLNSIFDSACDEAFEDIKNKFSESRNAPFQYDDADSPEQKSLEL